MTTFRKILDRIFYDTGINDFKDKHLFNIKRAWKVLFFFTSGVAILPLVFFAYLDYQITEQSLNSEIHGTTTRLSLNLQRFVSYYITERKQALDLLVHDHSLEEFAENKKLSDLLNNLKKTFGGFTDLGIINTKGIQIAYTGPYELKGKDYSQSEYFNLAKYQGYSISNVFLGNRNVPHLAISVKRELNDSSFFILRATMEESFINLIREIEVSKNSDAFLINKDNILQTNSNLYGKAMVIAKPDLATQSKQGIEEIRINSEAYYISRQVIKDTPFILIVLQHIEQLNEPWKQAKHNLIQYLIISVIIILLWIYWVTNYILKNLKIIDERRIRNMHMAEHASRMASIGKLAAGVAHEINNPLAIINEKAGYVLDKFKIVKDYQDDPKVIKTLESIVENVERCGKITKRLLRFSRQDQINIVSINFTELVNGLLEFVKKEAEYRKIEFDVSIEDDFPIIKTDKGKLEQIMLNLINNSIDAMPLGGKLSIEARKGDKEFVRISVIDSGIGIPEKNLQKIFDPYFTTKSEKDGTGLGLSITISLVNELGGKIKVRSERLKFTRFDMKFPINIDQGN